MRFPVSIQLIFVVIVFLVHCTNGDKNKKDKKLKDNNCKTNSECGNPPSGEDLLGYLSSKRPYIFDKKKAPNNFKYAPYSDCVAKKLWYFGRHGTRNPGKKDTTNMESLLPDLRDRIIDAFKKCQSNLCPKVAESLQKWKLEKHVSLSTESHLVSQGHKELKKIGKRYRKRFQQLTSNTNLISIKSTKSQRTEASSRAFVEGLLNIDDSSEEKDIPKGMFATPMKLDPVLKFYDTCKKWSNEVDENEDSTPELKNFETSETMNSTIVKIQTLLGIQNMSLEELTLMYTTCAFETAWKNGKPSVWCNVFDKNDLEIMAYREDLEYYWKDGYGYEINYEQACTPIKDLLNFFDNSTRSAANLQAYFSHSGATLKILARLGLFNDTIAIGANNFKDLKSVYRWKTSVIDTMATNMAFVLYECPSQSMKEQISFFFQELPLEIPACGGKWHCSFSTFKDNLTPLSEDCDLSQICQN